MISLQGKAVLITGGSRGVGRATALLAARAGADVGITYRNRVADAEAVAHEVRGLGRRAFAAGGNLADPSVVDRIFREAKVALGGLDHFVANAGVWPPHDVAMGKMIDDQWRSTVSQNLDAVFLSTRAALAVLRPGGSVVLVSSTAGQRGEPYHTDYAATKGALIAMTKSLCIEYAPGVRVNCVAPGWVDTEMSAPVISADRSRIEAGIPLKRVPPPEDIAGPILFLMSDLARHITGEVVNVNGGSVLCG